MHCDKILSIPYLCHQMANIFICMCPFCSGVHDTKVIIADEIIFGIYALFTILRPYLITPTAIMELTFNCRNIQEMTINKLILYNMFYIVSCIIFLPKHRGFKLTCISTIPLLEMQYLLKEAILFHMLNHMAD